MSEGKKKNLRYAGKVKNVNTQYGVMQKILCESKPVNKDGTPNKYFTGTLLWLDADGTYYMVKSMQVSAPKNGMPQSIAQHGFTHNVTIDLDSQYDVEKL
jgi:hypothetical protein